MSYRIHEISQAVREFYHPKSRAEQIWDLFMYEVDLDFSQLELLAGYVLELQSIGVNLHSERLRDTLNAYPENMEAAIQAVLQYAQNLRNKHQDFEDPYHATNCLIKALREGWRPHQS